MHLLFENISYFVNLNSKIGKSFLEELGIFLRKIFDGIMADTYNNIKIKVIYEYCRNTEDLSGIFSEWLCEYAIERMKNRIDKINTDKLKDLLNAVDEKERVYIFLHIFLSFNIYNFRNEWKYVDIKFLRCLIIPNDYYNNYQIKSIIMKNIEKNNRYLIEKLSKPMDMHRFNKNMLTKLYEYFNEKFTLEQLRKVMSEGIIDYRYYLAIRNRCLDERYVYDSDNIWNYSDTIKGILNYFSQHEELLKNCKYSPVWNLQLDLYKQVSLSVEQMDYSFEELILGNFRIDNNSYELIKDENKFVSEAIVNYILVNSIDSLHDNSIKTALIHRIQYVLRNKKIAVEDYTNYLCNTYKKFMTELSPLSKEKLNYFMKEVIHNS